MPSADGCSGNRRLVPADEEEINHLQTLRLAFVRRLQKLAEQQVRLGALAPPEVSLQIEDTQREIREIDEKLLAHAIRAQPSPSQEVKQAIRETHGSYLDFLVSTTMQIGQRQTALEGEVREVRKTQAEEREERPERQRVLDRRLDRIDKTLYRQDDALAEQTGKIETIQKEGKERARQTKRWFRAIGLVVLILAAFRLMDIWHIVEGWLR